jgi:hypothetical protein
MPGSETIVPATLRSIGFNRKELRSEVVIDAPSERVWNILTDFATFPEWNPFIRVASGRIVIGERLTITLQPSGGRRTTFRPTVLRSEPNKELRWLGRLGIPGLFDGQHIFELQSSGNSSTHFVQREQFSGIILPFLVGTLRNQTAHGFNEMNEALRKRAEERTT